MRALRLRPRHRISGDRDAGTQRPCLPLDRTATDPPESILIALTTPLVVPSAEVSVWPIRLPACAICSEDSKASSLALELTCCSTCENDASPEIIWVGSLGWVGSWFLSSAVRMVRKL